MPWKTRSVMDERIRFVTEASQRRDSLAALCRRFGISRPTGYRWLARYRESGRAMDLRERSRRPHRSPNRIAERLVNEVISLRLAYGWGARKLKVLLAREGIQLSESTINRVLKREGQQYQREVQGKATRRFTRAYPNELWQMDFKGPYRMSQRRCCPLSLIDDHSRYLVGLYALPDQYTASVHDVLVKTFERHGVPEAMLMDHGIPWYVANGCGLTQLGVFLIKQGVKLCFSGLRHPQTQGKVERFHRTLGESIRHHGRQERLSEWQKAFDDFTVEYNNIRPHEELAMDVPASRYQPSQRAYQANPPDWEYPSGAVVKRLNSKGLLAWHRQYYFVSQALPGEWVEVNQSGSTLLIRYRHMWIRQIDTETVRSEPLIDKPWNPYV